MSETGREDERPAIPEPEVSAANREQAARMTASYADDRPTTVLPGTDGMVSGTAISDWVDDNGDPIYGRDEPHDREYPADR
ncbi:hypothetical protein OHB26_14975 [Nocardia sp. NBC_01503]|uniref:hypothetical protein n=1 Tax=Nocardia sp. NBC_01503 TaxID=2975997 RepID=UPI002E7BF0F8|nr:hypothetical protein [Nocardia sp. NBC_01503]WTL35378.1 hypothetical protein OHB26_14975 [Nocardia sp. NBC_01503]